MSMAKLSTLFLADGWMVGFIVALIIAVIAIVAAVLCLVFVPKR